MSAEMLRPFWTPERQVDTSQASRFARALWSGVPSEAWVNIVLFDGRPVGGYSVQASDMLGGRWLSGMDESLWRIASDRGLDVYAGINATGMQVVRKSAKASERDVSWVVGCWADLDVGKDGAFATQEDCDAALFSGPLPEPTMVVESGSGGRHAYWLFKRAVKVDGTVKRLTTGWIGWAAAEFGVKLDSVGNLDRILRMPGTLRHPRKEYGPQEARHTALVWEDGPRYSKTALWDLVEGWVIETEEARMRAIMEREQWRAEHGLTGDIYQSAVQTVALHMDWADILEPKGWTLHHTVNDPTDDEFNVRYWTRPGKSRKQGYSATTDFMGGHKLSLYTSATECGLAHLESPITKLDAYAALYHGGDEVAAVAALREAGYA